MGNIVLPSPGITPWCSGTSYNICCSRLRSEHNKFSLSLFPLTISILLLSVAAVFRWCHLVSNATSLHFHLRYHPHHPWNNAQYCPGGWMWIKRRQVTNEMIWPFWQRSLNCSISLRHSLPTIQILATISTGILNDRTNLFRVGNVGHFIILCDFIYKNMLNCMMYVYHEYLPHRMAHWEKCEFLGFNCNYESKYNNLFQQWWKSVQI